jgi:hypothetical protein
MVDAESDVWVVDDDDEADDVVTDDVVTDDETVSIRNGSLVM